MGLATAQMEYGLVQPWVSYLMMMMVVLILLTCLVLLLHFTRSYRPNEKTQEFDFRDRLGQGGRSAILGERMAGDPLVQARRLADAGQFDLAIIYLYGYQLLAMDQRGEFTFKRVKQIVCT